MPSWKSKRSLAECYSLMATPRSPLETETALVGGRVQKHASRFAGREYLVFENEGYTYRQAFDAASDVANTLSQEYHVRKGDRVAICMRNVPEFLIVFWATALLGAVPTLINAWLADAALEHCFNISSPTIAFVDRERADRVEGLLTSFKQTIPIIVVRGHEAQGQEWKGMAPWSQVFDGTRMNAGFWEKEPNCSPDDDGAIFFTSGTTAMPKATLSSQRAFISNSYTVMFGVVLANLRRGGAMPSVDDTKPQQSFLVTAPLFHVQGLAANMMLCTLSGSKVVLMRKWNVAQALELCLRENVTATSGVPTVITDIMRSSIPRQIRFEAISVGSAPMPATLSAEFSKIFPNVPLYHAYGLTETTGVVTAVCGEDLFERAPTIGVPTPICDILIIDSETSRPVPSNHVGELWVRGPNVMKCYLGDPSATNKAITSDGWFMTGDLAVQDDDGFVYIRDRAKDVIIRGGENIHSTTIESALLANPQIQDAAAVGVPSARLGELPAAIISLSSTSLVPDVDLERTLLEDVRRRLAPHAVPVLLLIRDKPIDRSATGKVDKGPLRKIAAEEWERRQVQGREKARM
ncbi:expressed putative fatty acid biosynthesis enzyme [Heterobasidion irregulare TC 32-1]|uniref:Expressed putative fatty acid biosynthesis enzyme n=1 Tax=Heterobasidion irregulare (strain TC 32-1) TaxID=747525 RepID=W4JQV0_HETIT|nr:expressed putative fatty acid biosynthesis enzyme [Heterobasidion irregulare TC 32-1]ETW75460.1 expressed putative fatty acid biosynthesis enzyme [Heterobasidion irregulare TC 32-1]